MDLDTSLEPSALIALSEEEMRRAYRFSKRADRLRFAVARAVLRENLAREIGVTQAALRFETSAFGRPFLSNELKSPIDFNVSHSGEYALLAWSSIRRVGVDIEHRSDGFAWEGLMGTVFGDGNYSSIQALPSSSRRDLFYDVWVAKEALLKAQGSGIGAGLTEFSVLECGCREPSVSGRSAIARDLQKFGARWIHTIDGYHACVAWSEIERGT